MKSTKTQEYISSLGFLSLIVGKSLQTPFSRSVEDKNGVPDPQQIPRQTRKTELVLYETLSEILKTERTYFVLFFICQVFMELHVKFAKSL